MDELHHYEPNRQETFQVDATKDVGDLMTDMFFLSFKVVEEND